MKISQVLLTLTKILYTADYGQIIGGIAMLNENLQADGIQPDDPIDVKVQRWMQDPQAFPLEQHELANYVAGLQTNVTDLQAQVTTLQTAPVEVTPTITPPVV